MLQNFVVMTTSAIAYLIPDMPRKLREQVRREAYLTNEIILKTELEIARGHDDMSDADLETMKKEGVITEMEMTRLRKRVQAALHGSHGVPSLQKPVIADEESVV